MPPEVQISYMSELVNQLRPVLIAILGAVGTLIVTVLYTAGRNYRQRAQQDNQIREQQIRAQADKEALYLKLVNAQIDRVTSLENEVKAERARTDLLENNLDNSVQRANEQADALVVAKAQNDTLSRQMNALQLEVNSLKQLKISLEAELENERKQRISLEEARNQLEAGWNKERAALQREVDTLKRQVKVLQTELDILKPTVAKLDTSELPPVPPGDTGAAAA